MTGDNSQFGTEFEAAYRAVRRARRQRVDERGAFDQFCKRVERLPTGGDQPDMAPDRTCTVACRPETAPIGPAAVRPAYESTVMAVPHYRAVYDDPFTEHLATELGHDIVADLRRVETLTPRLRERVVEAASAAHQRRVDAIATLDVERAALETAQQALSDVEDALSDEMAPSELADARLDAIRERCLSVARTRRVHLREHDLCRETEPGWVSSAESAVMPRLSTLYARLSGRDPILSAVERLTEQLSETQAVSDRVASD